MKLEETFKEAAENFKKNSYTVVRTFIDKTTAALLYNYVILVARKCDWLESNEPDIYNVMEHGTFADPQAPGDYSKYGDPIFDTLLGVGRETIESLTGLELIPTYTYNRLYTTGSELRRHKDRPSCEISTTLCLGYNISNVDMKKNPNWNWSICMGPSDGEEETEGTPVFLEPGDMVVYRGCDIEHWREPFLGLNHAQVFLHYNDANGPHSDNLFDGRPLLGLSDNFKPVEE